MEKEITKKGIVYIRLKDDKITFTTDTPKKSRDIEPFIEELFSKFGIDKFEINIRHHSGKFHDKEVSLIIKNKDKIEEIIEYILNNFYERK